MVTTRSQDKSHEPSSGDKRPHSKGVSAEGQKPERKQQKTEQADDKEVSEREASNGKSASNTGTKQPNPKIQQLISKYGELPLSQTALSDPDKSTAETVLALVLNAILSSTRISHAIAAKTVALVIEAGYHKLDVLKKSTWQERTEVLTEGGYTHYREKTATMMGDLAQLIEEKYAPFVDPRSLKTAEVIGIGGDVNVLWKEVSEDPEKMCRLASALTKLRLDGKEKEFKD
ncbi:hypothetical protein M434DRAFT_379648 [Hypoxylon sp. CO27-5]|nr:hypothetical protein M434DRAFT_379648 [Hypoxylon sp. CO27-5]